MYRQATPHKWHRGLITHQHTLPHTPARVTQAACSINDRTKSRSYRVDNWVDKNIHKSVKLLITLLILGLNGAQERTSYFADYRCFVGDYRQSKMQKWSQKRSRFKHQIRVTICGLHQKLGGLAGLLPAQSRRSTSSQQTATSSPLYPFSIMRLTSAFGKQESHTRTTAAIRASCSILSAAMSVFRDSVSFVANMRMAGPYTSRNTIC